MASITLILVFHVFIIIIISLLQSSKGKQIICNTLSCGDIVIAFPFGLKESNQDPLCSYSTNPTFQLSCNNQRQTILNLPKTDDLIIKNIDYITQTIHVNDPKGCLPKRYLDNNFNLSDSAFKLNPEIYSTYNLTFLRCPSNVTELPLAPISCLRDKEHSNSSSSPVIVSWAPPPLSQTCEVISTALVPLPSMDIPMWPWPNLESDVELVWTKPRCGDCLLDGQVCGFSEEDENRLQVECFPSPSNQGLSRSVKYGIAMGVGIPGLLCLIGLCYSICGKMRRTVPLYEQRTSNLPTITISLEPLPSFAMGLDGATIEKYPKTLIGESGRLLKANDNTCSICLSEYQPKETLRSIPECNHYFHAACIDEWLKMNGTCPICRNSPETYSSTGPSFSSLFLSPNSSPLSSSR
ncbi:putative transcription factor C2H2 family [Medicago truncatula]|uniref:RING-type E3 ubiquitin transferase n=1 Tax=Medicago truncatula TaxID=3880 RepID=A0A072TUW8_MEDTR|nr:putative RING-H2 finger protein ATL21A [Medicago truncatula]KEH21232.1 RING-H2 finger protein ATL21A, putative [Medicago truncatula]RHN43473.1 putative transcription factor C2H2 family [Medicago truncatula]